MNVGQLIKQLQAFDKQAEIMILDGSNGGGVPRTINLGPLHHRLSIADEVEADDCDGRAGEQVVVVGYGCY